MEFCWLLKCFPLRAALNIKKKPKWQYMGYPNLEQNLPRCRACFSHAGGPRCILRMAGKERPLSATPNNHHRRSWARWAYGLMLRKTDFYLLLHIKAIHTLGFHNVWLAAKHACPVPAMTIKGRGAPDPWACHHMWAKGRVANWPREKSSLVCSFAFQSSLKCIF